MIGELSMRITLKALQYFLTAVEHESIARAAEQLGVVPSAVSVIYLQAFYKSLQIFSVHIHW